VREAVGTQVELGLVPFGSIGLTVFGLDLAFAAMPLVPTATALPSGRLPADPAAPGASSSTCC
jgi:hypothetical protein